MINRNGLIPTGKERLNRIIRKTIPYLSVFIIIILIVVFYFCGMFLPSWVDFSDKTLDDGRIVLNDKRLAVILSNGEIANTPAKIKVQDVICDDFDRDGKEDILIVCWKIGRYGNHRPFWVKHDELTWSQHIFMYDILDDRIKDKWCTSYIGIDIKSLTVDERHIVEIVSTDNKKYHFIWKDFGLESID